MSDNLALKYAESLIQGIRDDVDNDTPFGINEDELGNHEDNPYVNDAYDYLGDVLEIRYTVNSDREYLGAELLLGYGGPNVWLNTYSGELTVYWDEKIVRHVPSTFVEQLNVALEDLWEMGR